MLRIKRITELDALRGQATSPPLVIREAVQNIAERGEPWRVLQVKVRGDQDPLWLAVFPERKEALFFNGEETMKGKWDEARSVFFEEDGKTWSLEGRPVTLSALDDEAAEEDAGIEEDRNRRGRMLAGGEAGKPNPFL